MIGAIIGDIIGNQYDMADFKSKDFPLFYVGSRPSDDTFMTVAVAKALFLCRNNLSDLNTLEQTVISSMKEIGNNHKNTLWGEYFYKWLFENGKKKDSCGNGAAMRISPVGWIAENEEQLKTLSHVITCVSHAHPEGIKGAESVALAVYLAREGFDKQYIKQRMLEYYPALSDMTLESIRPNYHVDDLGLFVTCQGSVPQSLTAFFESTDFEDCIRNAVSIGGDSDTVGAISCSIAEAYYGVNYEMEQKALSYLSEDLLSVYHAFSIIKKPRKNKKSAV